MTYAVIRTGSKQYQVKPGDTIEVELLSEGKTVTFNDVLLYVDEEKIEVGTPTVKGISVVGEVVTEAKKGEKIRVFKFKHKSRYRKLRGHRQTHTVVKIVSVGSAQVQAKAVVKPAKKTPTKKPAITASPRSSKSVGVKKAPAKKK